MKVVLLGATKGIGRALAVYYPDVPPRLFWDEEYARSTRHGGIVAPEDFNPFAWFTADGRRVFLGREVYDLDDGHRLRTLPGKVTHVRETEGRIQVVCVEDSFAKVGR